MEKYTDVTEIFSKRLRELRGTTKPQTVADALGISRISLGYYEKGQRRPDIEILRKIADYYNVSADYLLGISDVKNRDESDQGIFSRTGLNGNSIEKLCFYKNHERFNKYLDSINMLLQSPSFESALLHMSKYIPLAKIVNNEQAELKARMESSTDGNYPYSSELDQQAKADEREMLVEEYLIDKACKNLIQELAQKASSPEI